MYSPSWSPPPTSLSTWSLWVFPVHQVRALVSCIQPGLFTIATKRIKYLGVYLPKEKRFILFYFFILFYLLFGGELLCNIVVVFVIHWHESAMDIHVFPIPIRPPISLSTRSLWVFSVHQVRALVSCIQPGLVICFTLDNIQVSMLFSWNIPPSPSPTESKILFYTSVSLFLFCV